MKICVPTDNNNGMESLVSHHFGMAPYFAFVDSETMETEFVLNVSPGHARGRCRPSDLVMEHEPDAVVTAEIGPGAFDSLHAAGKAIYRAAGASLEATIASLAEGRATEITREEAVGHHRGEGMHQHGGMHRHEGEGGRSEDPGDHRAGRR